MFGRFVDALRPQPRLTGTIDGLLGTYVQGDKTTPIRGENAALGAQQMARGISKLTATSDGMAAAYIINETAYRAANLRAESIASIPLRVLDKKTRRPVEGKHPLLEAIDFSRRYYRKPLIQSMEYSWCLFGETYIEKVRTQYGKVGAFLWLNPRAITPVIEDGGIKRFEYLPGGSFAVMQIYRPDSIIYDYSYNPQDDWRGLPPLSVAMDQINLSKFISDYLSSYFNNDARPGGILAARGSTVLSKPDQERLLKQWGDQLSGPKKAKKTVFLPASLEWQDVQDRAATDHQQMQELADRKVCRALGVPYTLIESPTGQASDNDEDKKLFYESTVFPRCRQIAQLINDEMLPLFGNAETEEVAFDMDSVRVTYGNQVQRSTAVNSQLLSGSMTINESRREYGRPEIEGGDMFLFPKNSQPVNQEDLPTLVEDMNAQAERDAQMKQQQFQANMDLKREQMNKDPRSGASAPQETPDERRNAINLQGRNNQPAKAELAAWQRKTTRRGLKAGRTFSAEFLSDSVASFVRGRLGELPDDSDVEAIKLVFSEARALIMGEEDDEAYEAMRAILREIEGG